MNDIAGIIGAISGCVSLLGIVYMLGVWRGKVDTSLNTFNQCIKDYPPGEMWTMCKTLWNIYVIEALHNRPDLATHSSAFKLSQDGEDLIPDEIKQQLDEIPRNPGNKESLATGYLVVKYIGMEPITRMAEEKGLSVQEAIAILSTYVDS